MTAWSIAFSPFLPWPALYRPGGGGARAFRSRSSGAASAARGCARSAWRCCCWACAIPISSRRTGGRSRTSSRWWSTVPRARTSASAPRQTDKARDELETRLKALGDVDLRVVETSREESETEGTKLFAALRSALADAPPERVGGAIMITDGDVHDIPQSPAALGFNAPLHALITGHEGERQRRIELVEAPRYGIVGKDQVIVARVLDSADHGEPVNAHRAARRPDDRRDRRQGRRTDRCQGADRPSRAERDRARSRAGRKRARRRQQSRRRQHRGRARQAQGAACLRQAASGRAHVAQSLEVRRQRGSGAFHHPASAGEGLRRHADQRTVADRLSGRRSVRTPDQGLRPHHLRSLCAAVDPALRLSRQYRQLRARRRRAADGRGAGILHSRRPLSIRRSARFRPPSRAATTSSARTAPRCRRRRTAPSGDPGSERPRRQQRRAELGPMVPDRRREADERNHGDERRGRQAAAGAVSGRKGAGGAAAERPDVALGARL